MKRITMLMMMTVSVAAFGADKMENKKMEKAIVAGGCFWGVEAFFQELDGVVDTTVGYTGGQTENPTYRDICNHGTGHAEGVEVVFDPEYNLVTTPCYMLDATIDQIAEGANNVVDAMIKMMD